MEQIDSGKLVMFPCPPPDRSLSPFFSSALHVDYKPTTLTGAARRPQALTRKTRPLYDRKHAHHWDNAGWGDRCRDCGILMVETEDGLDRPCTRVWAAHDPRRWVVPLFGFGAVLCALIGAWSLLPIYLAIVYFEVFGND